MSEYYCAWQTQPHWGTQSMQDKKYSAACGLKCVLNVICARLITSPLCSYCIPACWISSLLPPPLHHFLCTPNQPPRHSVQIHHTNTGQANDLPCFIVPKGPTATHNSPIPRLFQPLTATFEADWKYYWGVIWEPLSCFVWVFMQARSLGFKVK